MKLLPAPLETWYQGLAPRERRLAAIGGVVLALLVIYLAAVRPVLAAHNRLARQVHQRRDLLHYINSAAGRIQPAGSGGGSGHLAAGESVFAAVSAAAQGSAISGSVQRLEQAGNGGVRLSLQGAPFDVLVSWLNTLQTRTGIVVTEASIERAANPGTVNATVTLNSPE